MLAKFFFGMVSAAFWVAVLRCIGGFMCAIVVFGCGWYFLGPEKPEAGYVQQQVAEQTSRRLMKVLREKRGDIKHVAVMHFTNDVTDCVTLTLRRTLSDSGTFEVDDTPFSEKFNNMLSLRNKGVFSVEKALEYGEDNHLDAVIVGAVDRFEYRNETDVVLTGEVMLIDVRTKQIVARIPFQEDTASLFALTRGEGAEANGATAELSWAVRLLLFVLAVLLLPIITFSFIRYMVAKRSNKCNAFVLVTYTLLETILAFIMIGGSVGTVGTAILFLMATTFSFIYNLFLMSFALKLES